MSGLPGSIFRLENTTEPGRITGRDLPPILHRAGKPSPSNTTARPGEDGVSFWDHLANPWPLEPGKQPIFRPGQPYFTIDPSRLPHGSVVPTPPEGHWIVREVPPLEIKEAVTGRGNFPS
jgi:hypothetical protein